MKIQVKVNPRVIIEVEGDSHTELFDDLTKLQEVFSENKCGCCNSDDIRFAARQNLEGNTFYEMKCKKCYAVLQYGPKRKPNVGQLYPKRRWDALSPGEKATRVEQENQCKSGYLPDNGWYKWTRKPDSVKT